jgi:hypothetical protein
MDQPGEIHACSQFRSISNVVVYSNQILIQWSILWFHDAAEYFAAPLVVADESQFRTEPRLCDSFHALVSCDRCICSQKIEFPIGQCFFYLPRNGTYKVGSTSAIRLTLPAAASHSAQLPLWPLESPIMCGPCANYWRRHRMNEHGRRKDVEHDLAKYFSRWLFGHNCGRSGHVSIPRGNWEQGRAVARPVGLVDHCGNHRLLRGDAICASRLLTGGGLIGAFPLWPRPPSIDQPGFSGLPANDRGDADFRLANSSRDIIAPKSTERPLPLRSCWG